MTGRQPSECCPLTLGLGTISTPAPGTAASIIILISSTVFNPVSLKTAGVKTPSIPTLFGTTKVVP